MKDINPHEFYLETDGRVWDIDGMYGGQCWDLFAKYCLEYCGRTFSCVSTGYVIDLWTHFEECGVNEYFEKIPNNMLQDGDWAIWQGPCMITNYSHIAMFRIDNGNGGGTFLTQNPNGNPNYTHQMWISYQGLVGGLRPKIKCQNKDLPKPVEVNLYVDQLKINCADTMRVRLGHNTNSECIGFAPIGFYNIIDSASEEDYTWLEVESGKWIALYEPYCEIEHAMETAEMPQNGEQSFDSTNTLGNTETSQEGQENGEIIEIRNQDKENPLIELIKLIIELIRKYFMKGDNK